MNPWLQNCRSIFGFIKKENKGYEERDQEKNRLDCCRTAEQDFNSIFMNNKGRNHTLKYHTFFFTTFSKMFIIQIT